MGIFFVETQSWNVTVFFPIICFSKESEARVLPSTSQASTRKVSELVIFPVTGGKGPVFHEWFVFGCGSNLLPTCMSGDSAIFIPSWLCCTSFCELGWKWKMLQALLLALFSTLQLFPGTFCWDLSSSSATSDLKPGMVVGKLSIHFSGYYLFI